MINEKCGTSPIAGASFSIYPMCNEFVEVITAALRETNTSKVWMKTDDVTTTIRGKIIHIFDVTQAMVIHAAKTDEHIAFQATYSIGCPKDSKGDVYLAEDSVLNNPIAGEDDQYAAAKFSLYPLGGEAYMDTIYEQINQMKGLVHVTSAHYATKLEGNITDIFTGLEQVFQTVAGDGSNHTVMTVALSVNSPSHL